MKICSNCNKYFSSDIWQCSLCGHFPDSSHGFPVLVPKYAEYDSFNSEHFALLAKLEAHSFWFHARNSLISWAIKKYFANMNNFLEVGCGSGFVIKHIKENFPEVELSGGELYSEGLWYAKQRLEDVDLFQLDAREMPFKDEFDVIGAFDVIEHIEEDTKVLAEFYKALKPNGGIVLTVPQHDFLWSQQDVHAHHVRRYHVKDLINKISEAGFKVKRVTSFVALLLPLMWASRLIKRKTEENYDFNELKIAKPIDYILGKIMSVELMMIRRGISFPMGGSLLLVAQK